MVIVNSVVNVGSRYLFKVLSSISLYIYTQMCNCWLIFLFLIFLGTTMLLSIVAAPIYIPTNKGWTRVCFSPHPGQHLLFFVFLMISILTGVEDDTSLWFWFASSWWLAFLHVPVGSQAIIFKENLTGTNNMLQRRNVQKSMGVQRTVPLTLGELRKNSWR